MTRTILDVNVDRSESTPLHDQVAAEIRRAIADGEAKPGERLPLAKDIAAVLGVNKNTVLRRCTFSVTKGSSSSPGVEASVCRDASAERRSATGTGPGRVRPARGISP
jgi:DNA-binding transcriptional MocR family regulator